MNALEQSIGPGAAPARLDASDGAPERPVFLAPGGRRPRAVRLGGRTVSALMGAWLLALLAGAFSFGLLPSVPLLGGHGAQPAPRDPVAGSGAAASLRSGADVAGRQSPLTPK